LLAYTAPFAVDLCCGVGGLSLGFEAAGFNVAIAIDNDPIHVATYARNFPASRVFVANVAEDQDALTADIQHILHEEVTVLIAGTPCQGFSIGGHKDSTDPRNSVLVAVARWLPFLRPKYFVVENVPGLTSPPMRSKLDYFLRLARRYGYTVANNPWLLDACDYGVPQRRRRLFIVGFRRSATPPAPPTSQRPVTVWQAIEDLAMIDDRTDVLEGDLYHGPLGHPGSAYAQHLRVRRPGQPLTGCRRSRHRDEMVRRFALTAPGQQEPISRFFKLSQSGIAPTLRSGSDRLHGSYTAPRPIHPLSPRCITAREAARLHGFPDWFQFHPTVWHAFRQIGNAVPPLLAGAVAEAIARAAGFATCAVDRVATSVVDV
jgi:DNA (cytosine-5)-methyltransferase 1